MNKAAGNMHIQFSAWTNVWGKYLGIFIEFMDLRILV